MRPPRATGRFVRRMAPLALLAGVLVGVVLPAVHQRLALAEVSGEAELWAQQLARRVEGVAHARPVLWRYDGDQLQAASAALVASPVLARVRIDVAGRDAIWTAGPPRRLREAVAWAPVLQDGRVVARVRVEIDASGAWENIQILWISGPLLGLLLAAGLFFLSVATVRRGDERIAEVWGALESANAELEVRVEARTAELRAREAELKRLGARLVEVQEEERARISRDLHDDVGQSMTALRLRLTAMDVALDPVAPARVHLGAALEAVDDAVEHVRRLAHNLRPAALDRLGLPAALTDHARAWADVAGLTLTLKVDHEEPPLATAEVLFRVAQEALTNVARHARATRVCVAVGPADDGWRLVVEDDGAGLSAAALTRMSTGEGLGLVGARERVEQAGGYLDLEVSEESGLRLIAWVP